MNKSNLCIVIPSLKTGGSSGVVHDLAKGFSKKNIKVNLILFFDGVDKQYQDVMEDPNIRLYFLHKKHHFDLVFFHRLVKLMKRLHPAIISSHLTSTFYVSFAAWFRTTIYHTIHAEPSLDLPEIYRFLLRRHIRKGRIRLIGVSEDVSKKAEEIYGVRCPTIRNGITLPDNDEEISPRKQYTFLSLGRLCTVKNFSDLLNAFAKVSQNHPEATLCICGGGELDQELRHQIIALGLQGKASLLPPQSDVASFYKKSLIFCLFSSREGAPLSIAEAMAYGLPIVGSDIPGIKTYAKENQNGLFFPVHNVERAATAMTLLLESAQLRERISLQNKIDSKYFGNETMIFKYLVMFDF